MADSDVKEQFLAALEQVAARDSQPATTETPAETSTPEAVEATDTETPTTSVETSAGNSHAAEPVAGTGDTQAPDVNEELVQFAKAYGFSPQDVACFSSAEEFLKVAPLLDKAMSKVGQRFTAQASPLQADETVPASQPAQPQQPPATPAPASDTPEAKTVSSQDRIRAIVSKLEKDGEFDPSLVATLKEIGETVASDTERFARLEQQLGSVTDAIKMQQQQQVLSQQQQELARFKSGLDSLARPDLFGTDGNLNDQNLTKLAAAMFDLRTGISAMGGDATITNDLVARAMEMAFPGELKKQAATNIVKKVQATSRQRMGTGQRPSLPAEAVPYKGDLSGHDAVKDPVFREWAEKRGLRV